MRNKTIYFLFTDTGTYLSRAINFFTKQSLNHVSIGFDDELREVYSFGRKQPRNPLSGGFVRENIRGDFLKNAKCAVYAFQITESDYVKIMQNIKEIEADQDKYKYNFIGLLGFLLKIEINRKYALFCSQFVAKVIQDSQSFAISKPNCFTTAEDIRELTGMQLIFKGRLGDYPCEDTTEPNIEVRKQSLLFLLTRKVKQFVIK